MTDYGPAAPHGPDMTGTHNPIHDLTENERQIFDYLIKPDDSYDTNGVYWGDMGIARRIKFVTAYDAKESAREARNTWAMAKADPLEPVRYYFRNMVIPGAGLGLEGWVINARKMILAYNALGLPSLQIRTVLHWQPHPPLLRCLADVLEDLQSMQRELDQCCQLPRDHRYYHWPDACRCPR